MPEDRLGDLDPARRQRRDGGAGRVEPEGAPRGNEGEDGTLREDTPTGPERGRGSESGRSAAERLSELDEQPQDAEGGFRPPPPARTGPRYGWVVAVAAFLLIAVVAINTLPNTGSGREGPARGATLPDFAAPSALGTVEGDANIRQGAGGSELEGAVPACEVDEEGVVNVCELRERPVVLTFVAPGCEEALDRVEGIRPEFTQVNFVGVIIGESHEDAADILADHDWGFPIALDPDRAVFNLYRAADCPTTVTAEAGGEVVETRNGPLTEDELRAVTEAVAVSEGPEA